MAAFHSTLAWIMIGLNAAAGLWCIAAHWWAWFRRRSMWAFVIAAQLSVAVQVIVGTYLVAASGREPAEFHMLYGFATLVTVAILYVYRSTLRAQMYLLYGLGSLFLMGLGLRALQLS